MSVLVCTAARLQQDLEAGAVTLAGVHLLVFTCQNSRVHPAAAAYARQAPATARTMIFQGSCRTANHHPLQMVQREAAAQILRWDPMIVYWEDEVALDVSLKQAVQARPPAPASPALDVAALGLHAALLGVLLERGIWEVTPMQGAYMQTIMQGPPQGPGPDCLYEHAQPDMWNLLFVVPTLQRLMRAAPPDPRPRILVVAASSKDVDGIVADYQSLTVCPGIAGSGIAVEGLDDRLDSVAVARVGERAMPIVVGSGPELARAVQSGEVDASAVEVVVVPRGERIARRPGLERSCVSTVYATVRGCTGAAPQLVVSAWQTLAWPVKDLVNKISPGAKLIHDG